MHKCLMQMVLAAAGARSTMAHRLGLGFVDIVDMLPAAANSDLVVYIFVRHYSKLDIHE